MNSSHNYKSKPLNASQFTLVIPDHVYQKVMYWVQKADTEVSGFGSIDLDHDNLTATVTDAILLKQVNTASSSEIDEHAIGKAMYLLRDEPNALKWHWHSHVNMNVFWSGDDMNLIRGLGHQGFIFATVFNKRREYRSCFMTKTTVMGYEHEIFEDQLPTQFPRVLDADLIAQWEQEFKDNVKEKTYHFPGNHKSNVMDATKYGFGHLGHGNHLDYDDWNHVKTHSKQLDFGGIEPATQEPDNTGHIYDLAGHAIAYNPLKDDYLKDDEAIYQAIMEMTDEEMKESLSRWPEINTFMMNFGSEGLR